MFLFLSCIIPSQISRRLRTGQTLRREIKSRQFSLLLSRADNVAYFLSESDKQTMLLINILTENRAHFHTFPPSFQRNLFTSFPTAECMFSSFMVRPRPPTQAFRVPPSLSLKNRHVSNIVIIVNGERGRERRSPFGTFPTHSAVMNVFSL